MSTLNTLIENAIEKNCEAIEKNADAILELIKSL